MGAAAGRGYWLACVVVAVVDVLHAKRRCGCSTHRRRRRNGRFGGASQVVPNSANSATAAAPIVIIFIKLIALGR
jgi:hypothetical protein